MTKLERAPHVKLQQGNHKLKCLLDCREAIAAAKVDDPVTLQRSGGLLRFLDADGRPLGTLTERHSLAKRLNEASLLYCSVAWKYDESDQYPAGLASVFVATGDPEEDYVKWMKTNSWGKPREVSLPKAYPVNLVGESFYQRAIATCHVGDTVLLYREQGNPLDARAIAVKTTGDATIGYISRSHWLQRVIHEDGCGAKANILAIHPGVNTAVVLSVEVTGDEVGIVDYRPPQEPPPEIKRAAEPEAKHKGWLARLFGG